MRRGSILLLSLCLVACLWRSYGEILAVHVDVILRMADKIVAKADAGGRPTPSDVTELTYPLQRGRQFARQFSAEDGRASYRSFTALLDRYQALVDAIDAARADEARWSALRAGLHERLEALRHAGEEVRARLAAES